MHILAYHRYTHATSGFHPLEVTAYAFLDHESVDPAHFGIARADLADFSRYCLAARLHHYFGAPQVRCGRVFECGA